jgi:hypothetical protein
MSKVFQMSKMRAPGGRTRWVRSKKPVPGGRWFINYTDCAGKQIPGATSASTKRGALRIPRARMGEQARAEAAGVRPQALSMTLEKFLDEVYLPHARVTLRPSRATSYQAHAQLLKEHFGGKLLSVIARGDALRLHSLLLRRGETNPEEKLAPATINRRVSFFRTVLYEAVSRESIDRNPAARLKVLPQENTRIRVISTVEERRLLEQSPPWLAQVIRPAAWSQEERAGSAGPGKRPPRLSRLASRGDAQVRPDQDRLGSFATVEKVHAPRAGARRQSLTGGFARALSPLCDAVRSDAASARRRARGRAGGEASVLSVKRPVRKIGPAGAPPGQAARRLRRAGDDGAPGCLSSAEGAITVGN